MPCFFISATGTDAGKTFVTCALIHQLQTAGKTVHALKPVASGVPITGSAGSDAGLLAAALGTADAAALSLYAFAAATSPDIAAAREAVVPDWHALLDFCQAPAQAEYLLIEGAGGLYSPLTATHTNADLARALDAPVLLVAGTYLGAISHTVASVMAARAHGLTLAGIVINPSSAQGAISPKEMQASLTRLLPEPLPMAVLARTDSPHRAVLLLEMLGISS